MGRGRSCNMGRPVGAKGIERGLYSALARGIQELKKRPDALRPSRLVVLRAIDALVVQVALELPAFFEKHVAEPIHFLDDALAFARADIQPDARAMFEGCRAGKSMNDVLIPPDGGGEGGDFPKNARMLETQLEGNETAQA